MSMISYEVANERMDDYRREAERYRQAAQVRRQLREEEQRQHNRLVVEMVHEIVNRLSWRSHEVARG